jgi:hydrogenase/urease accessory protein HupE
VRAGLWRPLAAGAGLATLPFAAQAHLVNTRFGDFYGGALHLLLGLDHVLPVLALALLAGLQPPTTARWILAAVPAGLALGVLLAVAGLDLMPLEWMATGSFVIAGLLVALAVPLHPQLLAGLGGLVGVSLGYVSGLVLGDRTDLGLYLVGLLTCAFVLLALVAAGTVALTRRADWARIAARALGSWIAAIGLMTAVL